MSELSNDKVMQVLLPFFGWEVTENNVRVITLKLNESLAALAAEKPAEQPADWPSKNYESGFAEGRIAGLCEAARAERPQLSAEQREKIQEVVWDSIQAWPDSNAINGLIVECFAAIESFAKRAPAETIGIAIPKRQPCPHSKDGICDECALLTGVAKKVPPRDAEILHRATEPPEGLEFLALGKVPAASPVLQAESEATLKRFLAWAETMPYKTGAEMRCWIRDELFERKLAQ
jgi:hypothetical protein